MDESFGQRRSFRALRLLRGEMACMVVYVLDGCRGDTYRAYLVFHFHGCVRSIDFIVSRPLIAHLSLYTRLKPASDKKIRIMGLVYIFNQ